MLMQGDLQFCDGWLEFRMGDRFHLRGNGLIGFWKLERRMYEIALTPSGFDQSGPTCEMYHSRKGMFPFSLGYGTGLSKTNSVRGSAAGIRL
jgi:hypothetical protein